ncbi:hypothetical protein PoB_000915700 [Plakobranchus ocellatus]|uniref:Uncharacterized protein n=1 Tax=Plakobranchus ocellatus TaxID=259542 RepID=A0AAV3YID3_9GAST|nr:hypothetical protein PoB_000915700 [Plakobranchus ocellatus]
MSICGSTVDRNLASRPLLKPGRGNTILNIGLKVTGIVIDYTMNQTKCLFESAYSLLLPQAMSSLLEQTQ